MRKFDFLLIGAQKSATSWLWDKLDQHPGTDLPAEKEIHFFGSVELYRQGPAWYYQHFEDTDPELLTGEASTSYLFDRIPFWYNDSPEIEYAEDLQSIPELVAAENPDTKIVVVLRDPVHRAISAYRHWTKKGLESPLIGLRRTAIEHPRMRILEYGFYARYLEAWRKVFPAENFHILVYEDDVKRDPEAGLRNLYGFLGLEKDFQAEARERRVHQSWSWTRGVFRYYAGPFRRLVTRGRFGEFLDRTDFLSRFSVKRSDIEYLRECYLPEKARLEEILERDLDVWDYGQRLLT